MSSTGYLQITSSFTTKRRWRRTKKKDNRKKVDDISFLVVGWDVRVWRKEVYLKRERNRILGVKSPDPYPILGGRLNEGEPPLPRVRNCRLPLEPCSVKNVDMGWMVVKELLSLRDLKSRDLKMISGFFSNKLLLLSFLFFISKSVLLQEDEKETTLTMGLWDDFDVTVEKKGCTCSNSTENTNIKGWVRLSLLFLFLLRYPFAFRVCRLPAHTPSTTHTLSRRSAFVYDLGREVKKELKQRRGDVGSM